MPHATADEVPVSPPKPNYADKLPESTKQRFDAAGIDVKSQYPFWPERPSNLKAAASVRAGDRPYTDPGSRADPEKKALFGAATEVINLSVNIGTEIVGLQLSQLSDQQRDELALLIAERTVVFFRDQDITPQQQRDLGEYFGALEIHPTAAQVPGLPGVSIIWDELDPQKKAGQLGFRNPFGTQNWHTDLTHEKQPPGVTHLHLDATPLVGGDTYWASGYSAYDHLSPKFRGIIENLEGVYRSAHSYPDAETGELKHIETVHPLVRVHPTTGWKSLFANRAYLVRIVGLEKSESDLLRNYLFDTYERSLDSQIRFRWTPRTSALWDNRISIHAATYDHEGKVPRHGTRVSSLAEKPFFKADAPSRREALGLDKPEHFVYDRKPRAY